MARRLASSVPPIPLRPLTTTAVALLLLGLLFGAGRLPAEHLACPACQEESRCVPGMVASRVVCAGEDAIVEHESVTAYCLSCHGSKAVDARLVAARRAPRMERIHPMEVPYPPRSRTHRPIEELFDGIRLTDGKVTCLSCHGGRDADRHYISTHPREPALCTHCHLK